MRVDEALIRQILDALPKLAVLVFDRSGTYRLVGGEVLSDFGTTPARLEGQRPGATLDGVDDAQALRVRAACDAAIRDGSTTAFELVASGRYYECVALPLLEDGEIVGGMMVNRDVTHRKRNDQQLLALARTDALTGLATRDRFRMASRRALSEGRSLAVVVLDLDGFKAVNDTSGHARGDECLRAVARVLEANTRATDIPARIGGDEMALLLAVGDRDGAETVVARIAADVARLPFGVTVSAGIALYPVDGHDVETLLRVADAAMYAAKRRRP
jgi:diguanylate cyclase (GGDEF)-like protein